MIKFAAIDGGAVVPADGGHSVGMCVACRRRVTPQKMLIPDPSAMQGKSVPMAHATSPMTMWTWRHTTELHAVDCPLIATCQARDSRDASKAGVTTAMSAAVEATNPNVPRHPCGERGLHQNQNLEHSGQNAECAGVVWCYANPAFAGQHTMHFVECAHHEAEHEAEHDAEGAAAAFAAETQAWPPPGWHVSKSHPSKFRLSFQHPTGQRGDDPPVALLHVHVRIVVRDGISSLPGVLKLTQVQAQDGQARQYLDAFHRHAIVATDPAAAEVPYWRHVSAPPGAGKTTLMIDVARAWPKHRFLMLTFARDIAQEVSGRLRVCGVRNVQVRTLDSLCYQLQSGGHDPCPLTDRRIVECAFPRCRPWFKKKASAGVASLIEAALAAVPVPTAAKDCRQQGRSSLFCERHSAYAWVADAMASCTSGASPDLELRNSFAAMRARVALHCSASELTAAAGHPQVILLDEAQDLSAQAMHIVRRMGVRTIAVGDGHQRIYRFGADLPCQECSQAACAPGAGVWARDLPDAAFDADPCTSVELFTTYRLSQSMCDLVTEWTRGWLACVSGCSTPSHQPEAPSVRISARAPATPPLLVLVRSNREVIESALAEPDLMIVGGDAIADELERAPRPTTTRSKVSHRILTGVQRIAHTLHESGQLAEVIAAMRSRSAGLEAARSQRVISTVHRAKGSEVPHVAIYHSLLFCRGSYVDFEAGGDDACIAAVAMTRNVQSLTIIYDDATHKKPKPSPTLKAENAAKAAKPAAPPVKAGAPGTSMFEAFRYRGALRT